MPTSTLREYLLLCNILEINASFEGLKRYNIISKFADNKQRLLRK